jgi:hypothetical protein
MKTNWNRKQVSLQKIDFSLLSLTFLDLSWNVREDKNEYQTAQESQQSFANNQQANGKSSHNHTNDSDVK